MISTTKPIAETSTKSRSSQCSLNGASSMTLGSTAGATTNTVNETVDQLRYLLNAHSPSQHEEHDQLKNEDHNGQRHVCGVTEPEHVNQDDGNDDPDEALLASSVLLILQLLL